ncbi:MAG: DUF1549 and DUF1553 domain-containing protein [Chthoniobacter sp.]|uniref:DUF1549 and DUF1553 domain-containing protein n=1 Tax=Chthoniobacter sp. TaxID=2510640 RepID=UPI0032ADF1B7
MRSPKIPTLFLTTCLLAVSGLMPAAAETGAATVEIFPADVNLKFARDKQTLVVRTTEPNGVNRDVTAAATFTLADPSKAKIEKGVVYPLADGQTTLKVEYQGQSMEVPVKVEEARTEQPVSFRLDVMPIFMKAECNRCHGAARGQDGFRLSLWGFDPEGDHYRLTRELSGRRINLAIPEESMLVTKSTGAAPHTGGKLFEKNSELAATMVRWLAAGAPNDAADVAKPTSLEILPKKLVLESPGQNFKITVRVHYSDGTDRDVSNLALFLTSNEGAAKISKDGVITTGTRGEAFVMARYATFTVGAQVIVIPKGLKYEWPKIEERNFIDQLVDEKLRNLRITPSELCNDETFLRRAFIDITGTLPASEEITKFTSDQDSQKRAKKIDELLARNEFVDVWALKWSELLQVRSGPNNQGGSPKATQNYYNWLRDKFQKNVPMNEIARDLIAASGSNFENPAANYYQIEVDPLKLAEDTAQSFFGIRMKCAQCHNHPFDRWTMEDYRGFVAFFTQIGRKPGEDPREKIIFNSAAGESRHPVDNRVIAPKFLGGDAPDCTGKDRRQVLADWVASPENPYFPQHIANLVWAQYMGRGIVEPVDDVRVSNPASNPELLDALAKKIIEYNYDLRHIVRDICNSRAYQTATRANETNALDDRNFARATIRRMRAEVLLDCISQVTETGDKEKFKGLPLGGRSAQIADGTTSNYFLTTFGRTDRVVVCSREEVGPTLSQALHLLNGTTIEDKITQGGVVKKLMDTNRTPREIAGELFLRCFGRFPTESELVKLEKYWGVTETQPQAYHDIFWALLNAKEFMFNH